jgi:hypothetical protein
MAGTDDRSGQYELRPTFGSYPATHRCTILYFRCLDGSYARLSHLVGRSDAAVRLVN